MVCMARSLSARERAILDHLLAVDFPRATELRIQAESATATGERMVFDLTVDSTTPRAKGLARIPVQAVVDGEGYDGGVLLYVDDGRLSGLEYWWVTEEMPEVFPPVEAVGVPIVSSRPHYA